MSVPITGRRGTTDKSFAGKSFIIKASEYNRMVTGITDNLPIQTNYRREVTSHPFRVVVTSKTYPKTHKRYESFALPREAMDDLYGQERARAMGEVTFENSAHCVSIDPGVCFCQDTANVGPTFITEAWLLGVKAIERIKAEIKELDFSSCVAGNKLPPDPEKEPDKKFITFLWEDSLLQLKFEKYGKELKFTEGGVKEVKKTIPYPFADLGVVADGSDVKDKTLFHSDIVMRITRPKMKPYFEFTPDGLFAGKSILNVGQTFDVPANCGESVLVSLPSYVPPPPSGGRGMGGLYGLLLDAESDLGLDEFVVARVYVVAPYLNLSGWPTTTKPPEDDDVILFNANFVQQRFFSNVCYGWTTIPKPAEVKEDPLNPALGVLGVLAGGIGYLAAASMLSFNETASSLVMAFLRQKKIDGRLWYV
jgi:hypothetical protein